MAWLTSSISKKLSALIIGAAVTALNNKFGLAISPDDVILIWIGVVTYIAGQSHVDAKKALALGVNAAARVVQGVIPQVIPDPNMTYKDIMPVVVKVNGLLNGIVKDLQNGNTTAFTREDMMTAYLSLEAYFNAVKLPDPLPEKVGA